MILKNVIFEDFLQYKKPSMFLIFPFCSFKCDKEFGNKICQNSDIAKLQNLEINNNSLIQRYTRNLITKSVVCGGLEPFDSWDDLILFIREFRKYSSDDIVIYTGYEEYEISDKIDIFKKEDIKNIIVKFGRYRPNSKSHVDEILGVTLASDNQYAKKIN